MVIVILKAYDLAVRMANRATGHIAIILEEQYGFKLFTLTSFAPFIETKLENMGGFILSLIHIYEIEDATERVDVNSRFHTMIAHYSGNERIVDYLAGFRERVNRDMYISSFNAVRTHDCDDEHDQIVDAIERHDEVAAETAMRQHINNAFIFKKANAEVQHKKLNEV